MKSAPVPPAALALAAATPSVRSPSHGASGSSTGVHEGNWDKPGDDSGRDDTHPGDAVAWYVHAVLPESFDAGLLDGVPPGVPVEALPCQFVTMLVSRVPRSLFDQADPANRTGDPDWMAERIAEHHAVNAAASAAGPCLPMAFGVLFSNLDLLLDWLTPRMGRLQAALAQVAKQTEWALALQEDGPVLAAWLDENDPAVRQCAAAMQAVGEGTAFLMARRLDKARAVGRLKNIEYSAAAVAQCLVAAGLDALTEPLRRDLPSWTVLVPNRDFGAMPARVMPDALVAALTTVSDCLPSGLTLRVSGPWPAYAYARAALATEAAHG